jgi:hypothetical protein
MAKSTTSSYRQVSDHFEPDLVDDPAEQRKMRGYLEQIDYTVSAANKAVINKLIHHVTTEQVQNLALSAAKARTDWVNAAMSMTASKTTLTEAQVAQIAHLRAAYEELGEVYEATRRMVERGYLAYHRNLSK